MIEPVLTLERIDAKWIQDLLIQNGYVTQVSSVTAIQIGTGQVGATFRIMLEQLGNAPKTLVVKLPSANETSRQAGKAHMTYIRESHFYQHFAGKYPLPIPDHLYIAFDEDSHDFTLIMHDLPHYVAGDQLSFPSAEETRQAIDAAAQIHAAWWANPALDKIDWLNGTRSVPPQYDPDALYSMLWPAFRDRFDDHVTAGMREVGDSFLGRISAWANNRTSPRCLVHNDYRPDNMLFSSNNLKAPMIVVDWQTVGVGCGATDMAYYLGTALDPVQRRQVEGDLVTHYWRQLVNVGVMDCSHPDLWKDYRRSAFSGFLMGVTASMLVEQTERGDAMFLAMCDRSAAMVLDHPELAIPK